MAYSRLYMPRRRHSEESGTSLGSTVLRGIGRAFLLVTVALGIATLRGSPAGGIGGVVVAAAVGIGCMFAADARDTASLAATVQQHKAEAEQCREDAMGLAVGREIAADRPEHRTRFAELVAQKREAAGRGV